MPTTSHNTTWVKQFCVFNCPAFVLMVVALSTDRWILIKILDNYYYLGIFGEGGIAPSGIGTVRALCVTAVVLDGISLVVVGHLILVQKMVAAHSIHRYLVASLTLIAGSLAVTGVVYCFVEFYAKKDYKTMKTASCYSIYLAGASAGGFFMTGFTPLPQQFHTCKRSEPSNGTQPGTTPSVAEPEVQVVSPTSSYGHPSSNQMVMNQKRYAVYNPQMMNYQGQ